jgi:hypothetical protein
MSDETLKLNKVRPDGIETLEGGLEAYQEEQKKEQKEKEAVLELTIDEKKKLLRQMGKKLTDEEIAVLTDEEIEEIKEFAKLKEKKSIYRFVYRKKIVTDDDVKNLTDQEVEEMMAKAMVMSRHLNYSPKKTFGVAYKKKRQNKNKMVKTSRRANR